MGYSKKLVKSKRNKSPLKINNVNDLNKKKK